MDVHPPSPLPDPRGLARALSGAESELSREARSLAERRVADHQAWYGLVERTAVLLRRMARDLEGAPEPAPAAPGVAQVAVPARPDPSEPPVREVHHDDDPPLASAEGVLSGNASVVPISDLLTFLSGLRRSGMLWVETGREGFLVQLRDGAVVYAQGDNPPRGQLLGELLVADGVLDRDALDEVLHAATQAKKVLGAWLVEHGRITHQQLMRALAKQVQMIFDRMFSAPGARWQFEDGVRMVDSVDVSLNVIQLLLESARASDESHAREALDLGLPLALAS